MNWYAAYVRSNHEFVARHELTKKQVESFLPTVRKVQQWKDRKKTIDFPIFPGYLFIQVNPTPEEFLAVLKTRGVITLVSARQGDPTPVNDEEIESLQLLVANGCPVDIYPHLKTGTRVRVRKGPLTGAEGVLEKKDGEYTFLVNVELLGRSIGVKICADELEAA